MAQTTPFTSAEITDIRRFAGFSAYAAYGYILSEDMATLDIQCAAMSNDEQAVVRTTYLANLYTLETAVVGASSNLDTDRAAVWYHNKNEIADRERLFNSWRMKMVRFIGCRPGPDLGAPGRVIRT